MVNQINSPNNIRLSFGKILWVMLLALAILCMIKDPAFAIEPTNWTAVDCGSDANLNGIAYANDTYVAVGERGTIFTSPDGDTWTPRSIGGQEDLIQVAYGNGFWIAVGKNGGIFRSPDSMNWKRNGDVTDDTFYNIKFINNRFIAVGHFGILTSTDGINWQRAWRGKILYSVTYGAGTFCAIGQDSTIVSSTDGINWTSSTLSDNNIAWYDIDYGKGTFVAPALGTYYTSPDWMEWTKRDWPDSRYPSCICNDGTYFICGGAAGALYYSTDGFTWRGLDSGTNCALTSAVAGNGQFIIVGRAGTMIKASTTINRNILNTNRISDPRVPLPIAPSAPTDLIAILNLTPSVDLNWRDNSSNETGFAIMRKDNGGSYSLLTTATANTASYTDTSVNWGSNYGYKIIAKGSSGDSSPSNEVVVQMPTPPVVPGDQNQSGSQGGQTSTAINMRFQIGSTDYYINSQIETMDTVPLIRQGRTMLPIRFVATPLGASLAWDGTEEKATIQMNGKTIELWTGNNIAKINGVDTLIDPSNTEVKPYIAPPGRTMLPLRFITENLGCEVLWDPTIQQVTVNYPKP